MRRLLPLLLLSACVSAPDGRAEPQAARLSSSTLTVTLSDGSVCRADWQAASVGRMENCGPGYGYAVRTVEDPNLLRQMFTGLAQALGAEGAVPPMAEVVITDPAGIDYPFVSPPPVAE